MTVAVAYLHPGSVESSFHLCLNKLVLFHLGGGSPHQLGTHLATEAGSGAVAAARNSVVAQFLTTDDEWLFWLDADMGFAPDTLHRLLEVADPVERPIVGALCFSYSAIDESADAIGAAQFAIAPTIYEWTKAGLIPHHDYVRNAVVDCDGTGSACIVIHRSVFEKMAEAFPDSGAKWYFRMDHEGLEWGEDITFCLRAKALGFPTHVHTGVQTSHKKTIYVTQAEYDRQNWIVHQMMRAAADNSVISILVPSRGRAEGLREMWESAKATADDPDRIELVVRLDDDDPVRPSAKSLPDATLIVGARTLLSACWNECYEKASGDILMHAGDDIRFRTQGWDTLVRSTFAQYPDRIVFVYGRDGFQDEKLGTHGFLHRRWVETVGYFVPPKFSSDYNDTWLNEVAHRIDRRVYVPELYTEHLHPAAGKGELDQTHRDRLARHERDDPGALYAATEAERIADAEKLMAAIEEAA